MNLKIFIQSKSRTDHQRTLFEPRIKEHEIWQNYSDLGTSSKGEMIRLSSKIWFAILQFFKDATPLYVQSDCDYPQLIKAEV